MKQSECAGDAHHTVESFRCNFMKCLASLTPEFDSVVGEGVINYNVFMTTIGHNCADSFTHCFKIDRHGDKM